MRLKEGDQSKKKKKTCKELLALKVWKKYLL